MPAVPYRNPNNYVKVAARMAERLAREHPQGAIFANQFDNVANRDIHVRTTGPEIWEQTDGKVDGFVSAVGTGGTLAGVAMALRERKPDVVIAIADVPGAALYNYYTTGELKAEGSSITEGIGQGRITANLEGLEVDEAFFIPDEESLAIAGLGARRGPERRAVDRRQRRRRDPARAQARPRQDHRDRAVRPRHPLPVAPVQPGIPALEGPARPEWLEQPQISTDSRCRTIGVPIATQRGDRHDTFYRQHCAGFHGGHDAGTDQLPRMDRRRLGDPVLAPEGLHAGLHDRARLHGRPRATSSPSATPRSSACRSTPVGAHKGWLKDIEDVSGNKVEYPMIGDNDLKVAKLYNMLPADAGDTSEGRTAANNATVRTVYIVGPDKPIKAMLIYPMSTGRNFDEVLRLLDSIQLTANNRWRRRSTGSRARIVIIVPSVSDEAAQEKFPNGWKTVKPYLRTVPQPGTEAQAQRAAGSSLSSRPPSRPSSSR